MKIPCYFFFLLKLFPNYFVRKKKENEGVAMMRSIEKEYPILKEDRRLKESKNRNIRAMIYLGLGLLGIAAKFIIWG